MKTKFKFLSLYVLSLASLLLVSCDSDNEEKEFVMTKPPIGKTYEDNTNSITFVSADSVSFRLLVEQHRLQHPEGKAKYLFDNGKVEILNPHEPSFPPDQATESYFTFLHGNFTSNEKLEGTFQIISEHGYCVSVGKGIWRYKENPEK